MYPMIVTYRQQQIAQLLANGKSGKEVAVELGLSYQTVKNYIASMGFRLHKRGIVSIVATLLRQGVIQ